MVLLASRREANRDIPNKADGEPTDIDLRTLPLSPVGVGPFGTW